MELLALLLISIGVLGFTAYREHLIRQEREDAMLERQEMLDRLMSQDYLQFKESQEPEPEPQEDKGKNGDEKTEFIPLTTRPLTEEEVIEVYGGEEN